MLGSTENTVKYRFVVTDCNLRKKQKHLRLDYGQRRILCHRGNGEKALGTAVIQKV